jgi:hypothetical protein
MTINTTNHTDHALLAAAYLASASETATQWAEFDPESKMAYAHVLATVGLAEAVLAVAQEIREASAV